jgi:hypothetical protein
MSMKNSNYTIENRTRDLPACSAMPQPTAPPRTPIYICKLPNSFSYILICQNIFLRAYQTHVIYVFHSTQQKSFIPVHNNIQNFCFLCPDHNVLASIQKCTQFSKRAKEVYPAFFLLSKVKSNSLLRVVHTTRTKLHQSNCVIDEAR